MLLLFSYSILLVAGREFLRFTESNQYHLKTNKQKILCLVPSNSIVVKGNTDFPPKSIAKESYYFIFHFVFFLVKEGLLTLIENFLTSLFLFFWLSSFDFSFVLLQIFFSSHENFFVPPFTI